jgi:type II secretory pathway pseudopilin PulG
MNIHAGRIHDRSQQDDAGLTLIEVIIYIVVGGIVLTMLASVFINGMRVDAATRDRDVATGTAQSITNSITMSVRNATEVRVDGTELRARVAVGAASWECRAWYLDGDALRYRSYAAGGPVPAAGSDWNALGDGLSAASAPFTQHGKRIEFAMTVTVEDTAVPIAGSAVARAVQAASDITEGTPSTCW